MPGSQTTRGGADPSRYRIRPCCLLLPRRHRHPELKLSPLTTWPTHTPVNASRDASRRPAHDSGPVWVATPSPRRTFTAYLLPVSRRTVAQSHTPHDGCVRSVPAVADDHGWVGSRRGPGFE
jgi:hypothetical protein